MFEVIGLSLGRLSTDAVPAGKPVKLGERGTILAYDMPGPRGAPTLLLLHGLGASGLLNRSTCSIDGTGARRSTNPYWSIQSSS